MTKLVNQLKKLFGKDDSVQEWTVYHGVGGTLLEQSQGKIVFTKGSGYFKPGLIELKKKAASLFEQDQLLYSMTEHEAVKIADQIDDVYMTVGDYRRVLQDENWGKLFHTKSRSVDFIHGTTPQSKPLKTMPCYKCGLVLPRTHMTVDHVKPQSGGGDQAVLKVLRNLDLGLTEAQGKGGVAKAYMNDSFKPLPTKAGDILVIDEDDGGEGKRARYTFTAKGVAFLSAAVAASSLERMRDMCLNSIYNLKPYCAKCNSKKSNKLTNLNWLTD